MEGLFKEAGKDMGGFVVFLWEFETRLTKKKIRRGSVGGFCIELKWTRIGKWKEKETIEDALNN